MAMNRYSFRIGNGEKTVDVECGKLHTALYRLGFGFEEHLQHLIQPGLKIELVELRKNIRKISENPKSIKTEAVSGEGDGLDRRTDDEGKDGNAGKD